MASTSCFFFGEAVEKVVKKGVQEGCHGCDVDIAAAAKWFRKAAKQGVVEMQQRALYAYSDACAWPYIADAQGITEAGENMKLIAESLTPEEYAIFDDKLR